MPVDELRISSDTALFLLIVLAVIACKLWMYEKPGFVVLPEPEEEAEEEPEGEAEQTPQAVNELDQLNPDYGRYVWLAGKRYN